MNTIGVVFSAEFMRRIRSRAFLAGTVIGAVSIVLISLLPSLLGGMMSSSTKKLVLAGDPALTAAARTLLAHDFDDHRGRAQARRRAERGVPRRARQGGGGRRARARPRRPARDRVRARSLAFRDAFATRSRADPDRARDSARRSRASPRTRRYRSTCTTSRAASPTRGAADAAKGIAYLFVMLLYLSILLNAQSIMTSVAEEKTSRIAELLVATLDPARLLAAKILAAAATGFIQLGVWIVVGIVGRPRAHHALAHGDAAASSSTPMLGSLTVSSGEILAFLAFFIVGFAQYGVLYAAAASLINRTEDLGSVAGPLVVPVVARDHPRADRLAVPEQPERDRAARSCRCSRRS